MPANPNALTPARRGDGAPLIQGRLDGLRARRSADRREQGVRALRSRGSAGSVRWCSASAGLDQPGHPGGRHRVADQSRGGPEDPAARRRREGGPQGPELGPVGGRHAEAVALDQADRRRVDPRPPVGPADRPEVAPGVRRGQAAAPAVAGEADPLDDRVDPVAVALGVAQPLEHDDADALARDHPVGLGGEGPGPTRPREHAEPREDHREIDVRLDVDAADDRQVGPAARQRPRPEVERHQGRCARRVDDVGRPGQAEPVARPAGGGVGQLAGDRRRLERREAGLQVVADGLELVVGPLGVQGPQDRQGLRDRPAVLEPGQVPAVEVVAAADDRPRPVGRRRRRRAGPRRPGRTGRRRGRGTARARPPRPSSASRRSPAGSSAIGASR